MTTLDHLTNGRVGWNIVTSYLKSASVNIGLTDQLKHDERYDLAAEYLDVCYKLWEESWEDDAVRLDKENGIYTDPDKVNDIHHEGKYFKVPGAHLSEPSSQRTPVIYQAGASAKERAFAAENAECVFIGSPTITVAKETVRRLRADIEKTGRSPEEVKVLPMFTPIVGKTEEEANAKFEDYKKHISHEGALALFGGWTGIDLSEYDSDQVISYIENDSIRSALEGFTKIDPDIEWTVEKIKNFVGIGGMSAYAVGSPEQIADTLEEWVRETGIDGFNIAYAITPGTIKDFIELIVPILQDRGLVRKEYEGSSLRDNLFGQGDQLPDHHPGKQTSDLVVG
ncbi:NtaA/DmoA family FMN-dependent monooxygenase [Virgibacillus necropolis]|uniref:5,10-methylene tetrahydromethanopterin reductase n=1 Tax=Virgibacillus necropolis TaxID=163877 RepID=A0A221MEV2_9BACI|nr:NtaA/DmoA family FMN-dependent monooxygenase [Virgibacillus necropolis]ASN06099.1 5,10-methylene tetrahydromethanopterin reductase [Virgibacillus necropolis]